MKHHEVNQACMRLAEDLSKAINHMARQGYEAELKSISLRIKELCPETPIRAQPFERAVDLSEYSFYRVEE